jgi:hypothetical protein
MRSAQVGCGPDQVGFQHRATGLKEPPNDTRDAVASGIAILILVDLEGAADSISSQSLNLHLAIDLHPNKTLCISRSASRS